MNLPLHVHHGPRQARLLAFDEPAWIRIESDKPGLRDYTIKDRRFHQAIAPYLRADWAEIAFRGPGEAIVYSGADHNGRPLLPNITILPNLEARSAYGRPGPLTVLGCTMGHWHPRQKESVWTQEIYEFQAHGLMILDRAQGEVELWVMKDGDKVAVPNGCHMTLYNLGDNDHPLVTLDFADPRHNPANKDFIGKCGPILLACATPTEVTFTLNRLYIDRPDSVAGVRLARSVADPRDRQVRIARDAGLDLGALLHEQLTRNPEVIGQFARLGLRLRRGSPECALEKPAAGATVRSIVTRPLVEATSPGAEVYRFFLDQESDLGN